MDRNARGLGSLIARAIAPAIALMIVAVADPAAARPAASGWYAEGALGAVAFLPKASADAALGPSLHILVGRDLFSWLGVGLHLTGSNHEATVPPPPTGEWFQLYRAGASARLGGRFDRLALYVEGGAGVAMISSNVLEKVMITDPGERFSIAFEAGACAQYQLENRHYAVGLGADAFLLPQFGGARAVDTRLYLRYTY